MFCLHTCTSSCRDMCTPGCRPVRIHIAAAYCICWTSCYQAHHDRCMCYIQNAVSLCSGNRSVCCRCMSGTKHVNPILHGIGMDVAIPAESTHERWKTNHEAVFCVWASTQHTCKRHCHLVGAKVALPQHTLQVAVCPVTRTSKASPTYSLNVLNVVSTALCWRAETQRADGLCKHQEQLHSLCQHCAGDTDATRYGQGSGGKYGALHPQ